MTWPITLDDVDAARARLAPHLSPTPLRHYPSLDRAIGHGTEIWVKHENHQPTQSFKIRNGLSSLTALGPKERAAGVVGATRGNHGLGLALAGKTLGIPVAICVPKGNNPEKNADMRALGAELFEEGEDYDAATAVADRLVTERGMTLIHSTNHRPVIAGAATMTREILEQKTDLDALFVSVGGGSQSVGALTVCRAVRPEIEVVGVQAAEASAIHDSWRAGEPRTTSSANTVADGLATRSSYPMTLGALKEGLSDFLLVSEAEIADAIRLLMSTTHNIAEPAGSVGVAGLKQVAERFANKRIGVVISGGNIDPAALAWAFGKGPYPLA